jgi:hypothetical protein
MFFSSVWVAYIEKDTLSESIWEGVSEIFDNKTVTKNPHQQGWQGSLREENNPRHFPN